MSLKHMGTSVVAYFKRNLLPGPVQVTSQRSGYLPLDIASNFLALICRWLSLLGMAALTAIMFVITIDVVLRIALNRPIRGSIEIAELLMLPAVFLIIGLVQHLKTNISVDVLFTRFPVKMQAVVEFLITFLSLGICSLMLWQAFVFQRYLVDTHNMSVILKLQTAPFHVALVVGYLLISLVFLVQLIESLLKVVKK
ncbi:MAG TPA: TRAP transporter small permease [Dehalococcoidales bacterium]|nr:TRAP transporter small permease [Dehalococcoidales bacterium]